MSAVPAMSRETAKNRCHHAEISRKDDMFPLLAPPRIVRKVNCFKVEQHFFSEGIVYGANDDDGVFGRLQNEEHT